MHQTRTTLRIMDHSRTVGPQCELAVCHHSGTKNLEVTTRFLDNLYTPVFIYVITFQFICTISLLVPHLVSLQICAPPPTIMFYSKVTVFAIYVSMVHWYMLKNRQGMYNQGHPQRMEPETKISLVVPCSIMHSISQKSQFSELCMKVLKKF